MAKMPADGTKIEIDSATPGTPDIEVTGVKSYSGFDGERPEIDNTDLSSEASEFFLGKRDWGSFSLDWFINYADPGQNEVRAAELSGTLKTVKITFPDLTTATFKAYVKNATSLSGGISGMVEGSAALRITGKPTFAKP
ncbi:hypothetical protein [Hahella sp. NBU794]|uniref:hypothetical protein n=1 Tax=Hahella sp. NBU794 TaxID=3422590 RepID=UPI003D6FEE3C